MLGLAQQALSPWGKIHHTCAYTHQAPITDALHSGLILIIIPILHNIIIIHAGNLGSVVQWFLCDGLWYYVPATEFGEQTKCSE